MKRDGLLGAALVRGGRTWRERTLIRGIGVPRRTVRTDDVVPRTRTVL